MCLVSIRIIDKNTFDGGGPTISLVQTMETLEANQGLGWQGDIELGLHQKIFAVWEQDLAGTEITDGDSLFITVGYELV